MMQAHYPAISLGAESFSVEMWFKSAGGAVDWYLIHKGSHAKNATTGSTGKWFGIQYNKTGSNDRLTWAIDDDVTKTDLNVTAASAYFNNQWHHLVAVRDVEQDQIRIYLDGVVKGSKTDGTGDIAQTENLVIGNTNNPNATPTNAFNGLIDEVSIYKGVLTDAEIVENYQKGLQTGFGLPDWNATLKAYPVPFNNELTFESSQLTDNQVNVKIFNMTGQLVYQSLAEVSNHIFVLNGLDYLAQGSYCCSISGDHVRLMVKISK
jgi:hypothetical protein